MKAKLIVALFCHEETHMRKCEPLVLELRRQHAEVIVFGPRSLARRVVESDCRFMDLYAGGPVAHEQDRSFPRSSRYVTFASRHAERLIAEVRALGAHLVLVDAFAVIGRVVARNLGLPWINLCAGHNTHGGRVKELFEGYPRWDLSEACLAAVEHLRSAYGLKDASPLAFFPPSSRDLNVYFEPPEFLTEEERRAFEPVVFFGSLPAGCDSLDTGDPWTDAEVRICVSMGTITWYLYTEEHIALISAIGRAVADRPEIEVLVSLGNADVDNPTVRSLARPNVRIEPSINQWSALAHSDVFVTHHGLKSTHEAIWHGVPMLSRPVFIDQPGMARRAQALGLALPLADAVATAVEPPRFTQALDAILEAREAHGPALDQAREWERQVIAGRPAAAQRILELA